MSENAYFSVKLDCLLIDSVEHYPPEDEKQRALSVVRRRGGNSPNTLEVLQQLLDVNGIAMSLVQCAVLPSRSSTSIQEIKSSFGAGVDLTHCIYREECHEPASSYIIKSNSTDSRTIVNYNGLPEMTSDEFIKVVDELELNAKASWCHFEASIRHFERLFIFSNDHSGTNTRCYIEVHTVPSAAFSFNESQCRGRKAKPDRTERVGRRVRCCFLLEKLGSGTWVETHANLLNHTDLMCNEGKRLSCPRRVFTNPGTLNASSVRLKSDILLTPLLPE